MNEISVAILTPSFSVNSIRASRPFGTSRSMSALPVFSVVTTLSEAFVEADDLGVRVDLQLDRLRLERDVLEVALDVRRLRLVAVGADLRDRGLGRRRLRERDRAGGEQQDARRGEQCFHDFSISGWNEVTRVLWDQGKPTSPQRLACARRLQSSA
ncbi:MAG: hypothetical protein IPJ62_19230 [Betaproteobacteria bacterium]|nr:hypothetical protein [Betaproteobacteria bacterium]